MNWILVHRFICSACLMCVHLEFIFHFTGQSVCCKEYEVRMCVLFTFHASYSPCNFWFSLSILCSRICCRMAFLQSSLNSSLLFCGLSSGITLTDVFPLPSLPTGLTHTRPTSRVEPPCSEKHKRL